MATATELPIDTSASAVDMANEIFGSGIVVESATYFGDADSSGIYTNGDTVSPFAAPGDSGIILSTGDATDFTNNDGTTNTNQSASETTNTAGIDGDAQLNALAGASTFDASILEVVSPPIGDTITIDFVLSSAEYPEFINSNFNDVVGVWVNGVEATVSIGNGTASIGNINGGETENTYFDNTNEDAIGNTDSAIVEVNQVPYFVSGTLIETTDGPVPIEQLKAGMFVKTRDDGPQMIRWIGERAVQSKGVHRPIRIKKGTMGATSDVLVSPQQRIMIEGHWAELLFGEVEVLVKAKDLINDCTICRDYALEHVRYHHMLFDRHQIITANGVECESYLPGVRTMAGFDYDTQEEIFSIFPQLREDLAHYGGAARLVLKAREVAPLMAVMAA